MGLRGLLLLCCFSFMAHGEVPSIDEFTQGMQARDGFFKFYYNADQDQVLLEVAAMGQPFLFQSSLPRGIGSNDIGLDRGQLGQTRLVVFKRFGNKVMLNQLNTRFRASSDNPAEKASIDEAFADSVIAGFTVIAAQEDKVLIDYTPFLLSDIHQVSQRLEARKQGKYKADSKRSGVYLARSKAFPDNTELESLVTYVGSKPGQYVRQVTPAPESISVHLHHSLIRLPDAGYQSRQYHPFSGFWKRGFQDYSAAIDAPMEVSFIPRHRLAKKQPEAAVSEAVEPIVYYLDPGIPEPVKSALKEGALWWDLAFQAIGYKDAFQVKTLPADADPMDVRYNVIQWVHRATRGWSYGSSVVDPRSGEIIKGHVTLGSLRVRQDYLIALGLTSPFAQGNTDTSAQQEMALARIRQLSAHEVGHTLGIAHNFAASVNGRESVMDYPHPKISIINGKINLDDAYATGMGKWDKHVIAYGYQHYPPQVDESAALLQIIADTRASGLLYKSDADSRSARHATAVGHLWDNGSDPVAELERISEIRSLALQNLGINTLREGQSLSSLEETLVPIYLLHRYQLDAVAKLIGGVDYQYELKGDYNAAQGAMPIAAERQQSAIQWLIKTARPDYLGLSDSILQLLVPKIYGESRTRESFHGRTGITFDPVTAAEAAAGYSLQLLLHPQRLNRLAGQHGRNSQFPGVEQLLSVLMDETFKQPQGRVAGDLHGRLQHVTLERFMQSLTSEGLAPEVKAQMQYTLSELQGWLQQHDKHAQYAMMNKQIEQYWQSGEWHSSFEIKPLPPGSPI